jgi:uncharacterized protein (DUF736 family)
MVDYPTENRGTVWFNTNKKNEKSPDYTVNINVMGKDWTLSGWKKATKDGRKFISFSIEEGNGKRSESKGPSNDSPW